MKDITTDLIENINSDFNKRLMASVTVRRLSKKIEDGTANYRDAFKYACEIGNLRAKTLKNQISSDVLPNGKMYYNIANKVVNDSLKADYKSVQRISTVAQKNKNKVLKIGLNAYDEEIDQDNIDSIVDMISSKDNYDDSSKLFEMACATFAKTVVDRNMKANATKQNMLGLKIVIVRNSASGCCEWCDGLSGIYEIGKAPAEVWAHHNGCTCSVDYGRD